MSSRGLSSTTGRDYDDGATMVNIFPKLKRIWLCLPECREWVGISGWTVDIPVRIMPRLEYLNLQNCDQLQALPDFL
ncbi:hypothetical protein L484_014883 [Morus notabilis]|uniref:Disease resistance protein n=1 Tax=Morus notabilis TaxID=981085 RepID=W9SCN6_9ROSA|nr:hypothetical protein L484_014883 [Morus notabilis]